MTPASQDYSKPLALFFQEVVNDGEAVVSAFLSLELRTDTFTDPRAFLLNIRKSNPALCFIDLTTPKVDIALAVIKTIRSILGKNPPILALVPRGNDKLAAHVIAAGANAAVAKPIDPGELAQKLSTIVATDAISRLVGAKPPSAAAAEPTGAIPEIVDWHFEKITPVMAELSASLEVFEDVEKRFKYFAELLTPYREEVIHMVQTMRRSDEKLDLLQSLRMYGAANARALLVAMTLCRATGLKNFGFNKKNGLPTEDPRKVIAYAIRAVEHFGEGSRYEHLAFVNGLVFDLLNLLAQTTDDRKRVLTRLIENTFPEIIRRSDRALKLGKQASDLALDIHIFTTLAMREAGKIAMAIFYPGYADVKAFFEKEQIKAGIQHIYEESRFGLSHNLMGALICQVAPGLSRANRAVLFCDSPYLLKGPGFDKDSYALAEFCERL